MRIPILPYFAATAVAAVLGIAGYLVQPDAPPVAPAPVSRQVDPPARFGPGAWTAPSTAAVPQAPFAADTMAPGGLAATPDHKLVINKALRDVIDYFLFGGHPGERAAHVARLDAHLKAALPRPAYEEAARIVRNYLAYIEAHDQLLARESRPAPSDGALAAMDLDRIAAWVAQRTRLRQNFLGMKVTEIWFGAEQAETETDLAELRKRGAGAMDAITPDNDPLQQASAALDNMRTKGVSQEAQRQYIAARFGEDAARRFDAAAQEEKSWQLRYADYRQAVQRIRRQAGIDPAEQDRQIETLRGQMFAAEPDRLRARALDR